MRSIKTKLFSLAMAVSMVLALAGCAMSAPSTVGSIGGVEIPAGIYLLAQYNSYNTASGVAELATGETASDVKAVLKATCTGTINGEDVTAVGSDYVAQLTTHAIEYYAAVEKQFAEQNGVLDDTATAEAAKTADSLWSSNGDLYTANGISKSSVEAYLLNAQKAKVLLKMTYGPDGTSPVTDAEYTDYVNNDCYYIEAVQFPLVNYSTYSMADDDQKAAIMATAESCMAELNETATAETASSSALYTAAMTYVPEAMAAMGSTMDAQPGRLLRRIPAVHAQRSEQLRQRRVQQPDRPAGCRRYEPLDDHRPGHDGSRRPQDRPVQDLHRRGSGQHVRPADQHEI